MYTDYSSCEVKKNGICLNKWPFLLCQASVPILTYSFSAFNSGQRSSQILRRPTPWYQFVVCCPPILWPLLVNSHLGVLYCFFALYETYLIRLTFHRHFWFSSGQHSIQNQPLFLRWLLAWDIHEDWQALSVRHNSNLSTDSRPSPISSHIQCKIIE